MDFKPHYTRSAVLVGIIAMAAFFTLGLPGLAIIVTLLLLLDK